MLISKAEIVASIAQINEYAVGDAVAVATAGAGRVWAGVADNEKAAFRAFRQGTYQEKEVSLGPKLAKHQI